MKMHYFEEMHFNALRDLKLFLLQVLLFSLNLFLI